MAIARATIVGLLLTAPMVLAFFSGGYYEEPRLWAGVVMWTAAGVAALLFPRPLPRTRRGWSALGGLLALVAVTAASIAWTPLRDVGQADAQRLALYLGAFVVALIALRGRRAARAVEPALALGALVVLAEGLSERILPGLVTLERSQIDPGRLVQPLTYWNSEGLLAGIGLVLCARLAGDPSRPRRLGLAAAAVAPVFAAALQLTLSRGAILATMVGLVVLVLLGPTRGQLRAMVIVLAASAPAVLASALLPGVSALEGSEASRAWQGALMLVVLVAAGAAAAAARAARAATAQDALALPSLRRAARLAGALLAIAVVVISVSIFTQRGGSDVGRAAEVTVTRLGTVESVRGDFWRVALESWADAPLAGAGSGSYRAEWLERREVRYSARDAHSLYLETLSELGLLGGLALGAFLGGVVLSARRLHGRDPALAAGPLAVLSLWAVAAGLDWHWELPAVGLVAVLLAGLVVARGEEPDEAAVAEVAPRTPAAVQRAELVPR